MFLSPDTFLSVRCPSEWQLSLCFASRCRAFSAVALLQHLWCWFYSLASNIHRGRDRGGRFDTCCSVLYPSDFHPSLQMPLTSARLSVFPCHPFCFTEQTFWLVIIGRRQALTTMLTTFYSDVPLSHSNCHWQHNLQAGVNINNVYILLFII